MSTRYSLFFASLVAKTVPDSPYLLPWLLQHPFSGFGTHTHWPCSCIHNHWAATKVVFSACCFCHPFPLTSLPQQEKNSTQLIQVHLYCGWWYFSVLADGLLCTCTTGGATLLCPRLPQEGAHPLGLTANELQAIESLAMAVCFQHHLSWCPKAPLLSHQGRICITPEMGQESEEPWGKPGRGCQNSPDTPEQIPPTHSVIAVSSKLPQETGCQGDALGKRACFSLF